MTESILQAENKELKERLREMAGYGTANVLLKKQVAQLEYKLADMIMDKQEQQDKLAQLITVELFELGGEPDSPCRRIEFKAGPLVKEIGQGGFGKEAFCCWLAGIIKKQEKTK